MSESHPQEVAQSIKTGEYYKDALRWYDTLYHSPISQRAILTIITMMALVVSIFSFIGLFMLLPLKETRSMIVMVPDSLEKVASVRPLVTYAGQDANEVIMQWFITDFVRVREAYDVDRQQFFFRRLSHLAEKPVSDDYVNLYRSADSPTMRYERHSKRHVDIRRLELGEEEVVKSASGDEGEVVEVTARVEYTAIEETPTEERKSPWVSDITFRFKKIHVDQISGAITPMEFKVTRYESKPLGLE